MIHEATSFAGPRGRILHGAIDLLQRCSRFLDRSRLLFRALGQIVGSRADLVGASIDHPGIVANGAQHVLQLGNGFVEIATQRVEMLGKRLVETEGHVAIRKALQAPTEVFDREGNVCGFPRLLLLMGDTFALAHRAVGFGLGLQALALQRIVLEHGNGCGHFADLVAALRMRDRYAVITGSKSIHGAGDRTDRARDTEQAHHRGTEADQHGDSNTCDRRNGDEAGCLDNGLLILFGSDLVVLDHIQQDLAGLAALRHHVGNNRLGVVNPRILDKVDELGAELVVIGDDLLQRIETRPRSGATLVVESVESGIALLRLDLDLVEPFLLVGRIAGRQDHQIKAAQIRHAAVHAGNHQRLVHAQADIVGLLLQLHDRAHAGRTLKNEQHDDQTEKRRKKNFDFNRAHENTAGV